MFLQLSNSFFLGRMIGIRQNKPNLQHNMARSLPVSVPLPEGIPKRGELFDIPSDEDDEESDIDGKSRYKIVNILPNL